MPRKPDAGPANDPELLILTSLAAGPRHGYGIMADIGTMGGKVGPGTLYTAITRLVEKKLIAPEREAGRQRPYRITPRGERALSERLHEMKRVAILGLARLGA